MAAITYRKMHLEDAEMIIQTALEGWEYTYKDIFSPDFIQNYISNSYSLERLQGIAPAVAENRLFFDVAVAEEIIVGFCNIGLKPHPELYRIYLRPAYIGKGIGTTLIQRGEDFLTTHNIVSYQCYVHKDNEQGKKFYIRQGFIHKPLQDTDDEWCMEKILTPRT